MKQRLILHDECIVRIVYGSDCSDRIVQTRLLTSRHDVILFLPLVCGYEQSCRLRSRQRPFQVMRSIQEHLGS